MKHFLIAIFSLSFSISFAQDFNDEIDFLISKVGRDGCSFVRNADRYMARDARRHLRSKLERNEHLVNSTEDFILKLASSSATTGEAYVIRCRGEEDQIAYDWFSALLADYRQGQ